MKEKSASEKIVKDIVQANQDLMCILKIIKNLELRQGTLTAGSIRNTVWQVLSNQGVALQTDIDLVFFDPLKSQEYDTLLERQLCKNHPEYNWQVKNEVYMHNYDFNDQAPFTSVTDAIAHFVETPTCIGAYLNQEENIALIAPYGTDDLVKFICRPVPTFMVDQAHISIFKNRVQRKNWLTRYPQLKVLL
ncbi:hypothetical protein JCM15457_555 [Liquorilactobacillus sucicola DSM 21376 = JCM 15457]|uniref:Nucleotidyltransferase family protein n=1 Tax=Liquorilactobacillus sucicola DSM 21376 = JCM 15457 TaxID=1423806 RepID=A0A023CUY7_9LACO|nr:nucleotidyltransferase family protein [Liquorilactobacillus sucicola]KRN05592.1 hypothetical protein FD15_GL002155 [Liquorilactobacillus sucicola DSM 21376 = JCM 15457]GAJ25678.1 hypothetical protein JCM15457_555 [Liquorilactobacillus sucicola DSM 21376 = JCM 15457]